MSKTCAFLGNDYGPYGKPKYIEKYLSEQILKLIKEEDVTTFYVGSIGAYESTAYNVVLDIKKTHPSISIILVISSRRELIPAGMRKEYNFMLRAFDDFIFPDEAMFGYKRWCIVHRNNWIINNTDFIIAYNYYEGRAFKFCKRAQNKGVQVIELTEVYDKSTFE